MTFMKRNWRKLIIRAGLAMLMVVVVFLTLYAVELKRSEAELRVVLSDLISEALSRPAPDSAFLRRNQVIILSNAAQPGLMPGLDARRWTYWFDQKSRFPQASLVTRYNFLLTNLFPTKIKANIHLANGAEVIVLDESEQMKGGEFEQR